MNLIKRFLKEDDGPTATEYAAMLAFIILASVVILSSLGVKVSEVFQTIGENMGDIGEGA